VLPFVVKRKCVLPGESSKRVLYRFGPFQRDASDTTLTRNGSQLKLQDLPYRLLVILVERPGEIVSREEVRQRLWPQNTFVEFDNSLGVAIRKIRDALGDNADASCYGETIPRRGYRFLAPVTTATEAGDLLRSATGETARPQSSLPKLESVPPFQAAGYVISHWPRALCSV
jgi:DNA-binding winged helix-turn-helix (wHTH) protein